MYIPIKKYNNIELGNQLKPITINSTFSTCRICFCTCLECRIFFEQCSTEADILPLPLGKLVQIIHQAQVNVESANQCPNVTSGKHSMAI